MLVVIDLLGGLTSYTSKVFCVTSHISSMATESSAIARFVNQAQSHAIRDPYAQNGMVDIMEPAGHVSGPMPTAPQPPVAPPTSTGRSGGLWLALIGVVVIGGAVAGGYVLAQQEVDQAVPPADSIGAKTAEAPASLEPESAASLDGENVNEAGAAPADAGEDTIEPDTDPSLAAAEPGAIDVELAKQTGFDILVEPAGAVVSLDGHKIGVAPLRVRNLLPGAHGIDIEGPDGFFGKHLEFDLAAGQAQVLEIELVAIDGQDEKQDDASAKVEATAKRDDRSSEGSQRKKTATNKKVKDIRKIKRANTSKDSSAKATKTIATAGQVSLGTLMLGAKPPCEIVIDGKNTGLTTPQRSIQLPEGSHRVILVNEQHGIKKSFKVNIKAGRTTRAIQDLSKSL